MRGPLAAEMNSLFARASFRLRATARRWCVEHPRALYWRLFGMVIGQGTTLARVHVTWPHQVSFGERCRVEHDVYFKFDGIYRPGPSLVFADDVFIGSGCEFNIRAGLHVGRHCLIASGCRFVDHDHGFATRAVPMSEQTSGAEAAIVLEEDVWLGANVIVLKGVTVQRGAIIAAGSVLTRSVGAFEIWGGTPARMLRSRPDA